MLTRLSGSVFALNSDLIERVDATPDTVITLVDGTKYVVSESLKQVVSAVIGYRGGVIAESARLASAEPAPEPEPEPEPVGCAPAAARRLVAVPAPTRPTSAHLYDEEA